MTTHSTVPFPDGQDREKAWAAAVAERRGGAAYVELIVSARLYNPAGEVVADCEGLFLRLLPGQA